MDAPKSSTEPTHVPCPPVHIKLYYISLSLYNTLSGSNLSFLIVDLKYMISPPPPPPPLASPSMVWRSQHARGFIWPHISTEDFIELTFSSYFLNSHILARESSFIHHFFIFIFPLIFGRIFVNCGWAKETAHLAWCIYPPPSPRFPFSFSSFFSIKHVPLSPDHLQANGPFLFFVQKYIFTTLSTIKTGRSSNKNITTWSRDLSNKSTSNLPGTHAHGGLGRAETWGEATFNSVLPHRDLLSILAPLQTSIK